LLKRHHLERCLIRAGLLQHKNNESKTPGQSQGFVSSLRRLSGRLFLRLRGVSCPHGAVSRRACGLSGVANSQRM
ncbi:hypothetical protein LC092_20440, partial [Stappia stellulata]|uniref:hypothetical protein n=1 Tax=Stappia stellulata TaxID=71235 RepID=UPI001CD19D14